MDPGIVAARVEQALADNRRAERLIAHMALGVFAVGLLVTLVAYSLRNPYLATGGTLMQGFLAFPINEVRKLRRDNLILQTFPGLIQSLPPDKAAAQIIKLLEYLRGVAQ
jgi:hypothetical protein